MSKYSTFYRSKTVEILENEANVKLNKTQVPELKSLILEG